MREANTLHMRIPSVNVEHCGGSLSEQHKAGSKIKELRCYEAKIEESEKAGS